MTTFGGIFHVMNQFDLYVGSTVNKELGLRVKTYGYDYSEIFRALWSVYFCGGSCIEDLNQYLKEDLMMRPNTAIPSSDTVLRGIKELTTDNIEYTSTSGLTYSFNPSSKMNTLLLKLLMRTGLLKSGEYYDLDFDHQFIESEKFDAKRTYKGFKGYSPGVSSINGMIVHLENRDGNANVRFKQEKTLERMFQSLDSEGIKVRRFRADCGSYSKEVIKCALKHAKHIYIRAERCGSLYEKIKSKAEWQDVEIGFEKYEVASFPFESFEDVDSCRLVVQRQKKKANEQLDLYEGEYIYRSILTNDLDMTEQEVIQYYNGRGAAERIFDAMNNDFGWNRLPKSFMDENTVFLLMTAMAYNFYRFLLQNNALEKHFDLKTTSRIKKFIFRFISVPAKWIKTARCHVLNIYSTRAYDKIFALE